MTVHVGKSGLFSVFAHDHQIAAPIARGELDESPAAARVELWVNSAQLRVADKGISARDRSQIQTTMLGPKVLDADAFPEIHFRSTSVVARKAGQWTVSGELELHGVKRAIRFEVQRTGRAYRGTASLKQSDFGIEPVTIAGGTVKVKDEVSVEFEIVAAPGSSGVP